MAAQEDRHLPVREIINLKFNELLTSSLPSKAFIYKAPRQLRQVNGSAYEPQIISIGPYHRGKYHLKTMEIHKVRYLSSLLQRCNDQLDCFIHVSMSMEGRARDCYADTLNMQSADFVAMMVLDGLFIVELIRKFNDQSLIEKNDALFKQNLNLSIVAHDLLLLENQLPFFVLKEFAVRTGLSEELFVNYALGFLLLTEPRAMKLKDERHLVIQDSQHLLGLVHDNRLPPTEKFGYKPEKGAGKWNPIHSATELFELGIRFKKGRGNSLFDIKFEKGQMHIPTVVVNHDTERIFRNLIAYEQLSHGFGIFMDYARLMDCLINYADDVALLTACGIIDNRMGTNEAVARLFNKLNDYVYLSNASFYYSDLFDDVNRHCRQRWTLWKVKLRQKYSHTPWDWVLTSIVVGTVLLLLTLLQAIFSVLAYFK